MSKIEDFEKFGQKAKAVPGFIRFGLLGIAIALTVYSIVDFSGPYRWLSYAQADLFDGEYYILLSGLLTVLIYLLPAVIIVRALVPYYTKKNKVEEIPEGISFKRKSKVEDEEVV